MRVKNVISWTVLVALLAGGYLAVTNAQNIMDWYALRNYDPPKRVVKLADVTTMKSETRRVFYVNHPQLSQKAQFREQCKFKEQSIVLGCFITNKGIFLLDVEEPKLNGVIEVTAGHEVLHALYTRLSSGERQKVDQMTSQFFANLKDERIKKTVENYRKNDASVVPSELHSILGTEVKDLSPELEDYYGQYFADRQQIVDYSTDYEQTFVQIEDQVENLDGQLDSLKIRIDNNQAQLSGREAEIEQKRRELDRLLAENKVEEYNSQVAVFNQLVESYNQLINDTRQLANRYNTLVQQRNSLVTAEQELKQALDSSVMPQKETR